MSCYPIVPLSDVCDVRIGRTPRRDTPRFWGGTNLWVTVSELDKGELFKTKEGITDAAIAEVMPAPVEPGTLLFSFKLSIGKMAFAGVPMHHNEAIAALPILDPTQLDARFLYYALRAKTHDTDASHAVLGKVLNKAKVAAIEIPLPPIEEQRRIVDILNRAASIERLKARASAHLRDFIPALFLKMFGDPIENPMGWPTSALGDLLEVAQYGSSKKADAGDDAIPVLRMGNVSYDGYLDCSKLKYVELPDSELDKYLLAKGDLLFNRTNSKELVGKTGIWDGRFTAIAASYFIRLRVDYELADPTYLWAFLNSASMKAKLFDMARGAIGQANINAKELQAITVPVPPLERQQAFAKLVEAAAARSRLADTASDLAADLSRSLLDKLLSTDGTAQAAPEDAARAALAV